MKKGFIALIVLALAAMLFVGCDSIKPPTSDLTNLGTTSESKGTIQVHVTDAPGDVTEVNVTVSEVEVHKAGDEGESGQWIYLAINEETFNLIELQDITLVLAEEEVEAGKYTQLRMTVFEVVVKTEDGPEDGYQATIPSDKLKFVRPFTLEAGGEIHLIVDIDASKSVLFPGGKKGGVKNEKVIFKPVVKLMIEHEEGPGTPPTPYFDPTSGPVGTEIAVAIPGWVALEVINPVTVGGETATHTLTVDGGGNISGSIFVPALAPGDKDIVITGATSGEQTFADAFTVTVTATFNPTSGAVGTEIAVTGTGWVALEVINPVTVGGEAATHTLTVDGGGNLSGTITVPAGLIPDTYSIVITGASSGEQTFADAFEVTPYFDPTSGPVGTEIAVTIPGWVALEVINPVTVGGITATHTMTVDGGGNLSGSIWVPALAPGDKDIVITGATSGEQTFADAFEVTATATFNPTNGAVGTEIAVTGTGWVALEVIDPVTVGGIAATHTLAVDGGGNLSGSIWVPALAPGDKDIVITGASSSEQTFPDAFTVNPTATFTPFGGPVGTVITVAGAGWVAEELIDTVTVGGEVATYILTVDVSGVISGTITVPVLAPGIQDIVITGASSGEQTFTNAFTVT